MFLSPRPRLPPLPPLRACHSACVRYGFCGHRFHQAPRCPVHPIRTAIHSLKLRRRLASPRVSYRGS